MLDQMQEPSTLSLLTALLEQDTLVGQDCFFDSYEEAPFTEEEMTEEVEGNRSQCVTIQDQLLAQGSGMEPFSYLYRPGYVVARLQPP
ncbi:MAG: hypothetical protein ABI406_04680 [Ktedonobacteraceae bacterium]